MENKRSESGEFTPIPKLFELHMKPFEVKIDHLRQAIEKLTKNSIAYEEFNRVLADLKAVRQENRSLDERLDRLEHQALILKWVLGLISSVGTAVVIGLVTKLIG